LGIPKPYALDDRYLADEGVVFLTGIQAGSTGETD